MIVIIVVHESKFAMIILIKKVKVSYEFKLRYDVKILNRLIKILNDLPSSSLNLEYFLKFPNLHQKGYTIF